MILTGSEDIRVRKTITSIHRTFCEMICEMSYKNITVKELCERAMINKKTFYTYYETLDFLLREVQNSYSDPFIAEIKNYTIPKDIDKLIRAFFEFSARQDEAYEKITCETAYRGIRGEMIEKVKSNTSWSDNSLMSENFDDFQNNVMFRLFNDTILMAYEEWIKEGKATPLEEVIDFTRGLILNGIEEFIKIK